MQEVLLRSKKTNAKSRAQCYEIYTYEGFVNKDNKIVLEGEQMKERK
jgi:hypothetical protein